MPIHKPAHPCVTHTSVCIIMRYVLHYITHDDVVQVLHMMYLDVHTSRHDHLDVYVYYMMMRHRSRRDENLVHNLVDST